MYDLIIIGGGPAGITAAIYGGRYGLKTLLVAEVVGGEISTTDDISNFPGFKMISGFEISQKWQEHVKSVGTEIKNSKVDKIAKKDNAFAILAGGETFKAKSLILATGMERRKLGVPGEAELKNKGVAYCATCDGPLYKGKNVVVVGGGNAGVEAALLLADIASKVYLIEVLKELPAHKQLTDMLAKKENVQVLTENQIEEIRGNQVVESVNLKNEVDGSKEIKCNGVFIEIGSVPNPVLAKSIGAEVDKKGFIKVDAGQKTNIEGLFAAGDATTNSNFFWQAITAAAEGAIAADSANKYLK